MSHSCLFSLFQVRATTSTKTTQQTRRRTAKPPRTPPMMAPVESPPEEDDEVENFALQNGTVTFPLSSQSPEVKKTVLEPLLQHSSSEFSGQIFE
ncbi:hypothetical protein GMAR_ORF51 [Golden Marseillevirus]|uniref:hypothetical protein n=1 Tax=Golden Marseillevirus TaxID=1720526 RepID=UPI000877AB0F|nr:hypothetical protein GMAR_ORF51 [Golden Marseillevirus]ALX27426.1 hypothetical protein GMAR_ORF51 [Golden Marseillevirus]